MAIGQDKLLVTPLQMAMVAPTIANGGMRMEPRLMATSLDPDGARSTSRARGGRARDVRGQRRRLTDDDEERREGGHGHRGRAEGIEVAGKTGTAELNLQGLNDAWFIGFTDEVAVAVAVERSRAARAAWSRRRSPSRCWRPCASEMHEIEPDTVIDGRYRVLKRLGSGGMADVYCAEDVQLGRGSR